MQNDQSETLGYGVSMTYYSLHYQGYLEVICGPMFSGKTEELIRRVRRAQIARQKVQIFKPSIDNRYHEKEVVSHSAQSIPSEPIDAPEEIFDKLRDATRIVALDEVQFFDKNVIPVVQKLVNRGYRVICAGLDLDYRAVPFGPMPFLLALADEVVKIKAICTICGAPASRSQRICATEEQILVGESSKYEARCRAHYEHEPEDTILTTENSESEHAFLEQTPHQ